ncbi:nucleoid-associated protein [Chitiniphilus eburneus]|uniref:Nucleoid-associated protein n=1 Tax=Chitiniphilus eburneus TaxID=2571148 RepID=A0A4U0Q7T3_9NEIS|nr:nucleoid-associated protein [Chitiniphilus eburneus]TJZ77313.1 nucleoid-associated protein [Chitiniphilus eburneus]
MTAPQPLVRHLVVHKLIKDPHGPAAIALRPAEMSVNAAAQRLIDHLGQRYGERKGKGYGRFEDDEDNFPMPRFMRQYVAGDIDFLALSHLMMQHLQMRAGEEQLASGGYVLIARVDDAGADCLLVVLVTEVVGMAITGDFEIVDSPQLDLSNLRVAGRIDLTAWQGGAERYISFLKGRADVAHYFKLFLGCNDVVLALKETQKLVQGLNQFAERQQLPPATRDALFERAHGYLDEAGDEGEPVALDVLVRRAWPEAPERLQSALAEDELALAGGFVPDRRAIKPLMRFKASGEHWKIEFDRSSLRAGQVIYDRERGALVLTEIPEALRQALIG